MEKIDYSALSKSELEKIFSKGRRVKLISMDGESSYRMPAGLIGEVACVDDLGQVHVKWRNGSSLALIPEVDKFQLL